MNLMKNKINMIIISIALLLISGIAAASASAAGSISIRDVEISSEEEDNLVAPGEILKIDFSIKNTGDADLEDITAEMWFEKGTKKLRDNNDDAVSPEFDFNDLVAGDDDTASFEFQIPWDVNTNDEYSIYIKATADTADTSETITREETVGTFTVKMRSHEIIIQKAELANATAGCPRTAAIAVELRNIGRNKESVNLTIKNKNLGIDFKESTTMSDDADDASNGFSKSYSFPISTLANIGKYPVIVSAIYSTDSKYQQLNLTIDKECGIEAPPATQQGDYTQDPVLPSGAPNPDFISAGDGQDTNQPIPKENLGTTTPTTTIIPASKKESSLSQPLVLGLITALIVLVIAVVILAIVLAKKN